MLGSACRMQITVVCCKGLGIPLFAPECVLVCHNNSLSTALMLSDVNVRQVSYTDKVVEPAASNGAAAPQEEEAVDTNVAEPAASES